MRLTVAEIMAATGATGDIAFGQGLMATSVTADSRKAGPGSLFCCLPGSRADGHEFALQAVKQGAVAVLAARNLPEVADKAAVLVVPDVLRALSSLARFWRGRAKARVVALSGSAGKSTVKEFLASILAGVGPTMKNPGNYNNQLGLPLSVLAGDENDRFWVLELGISRQGDMEELAALCEPDLAVVHNIGPAHLEGLGDLAGVAKAKAALFGFVRKGGAAIANRDYPLLWKAAQAVNPGVIPMSTISSNAPFHGHFLDSEHGGGRYHLSLEGTSVDVVLPCQGAHLTENILAAAAVASILGATPEQITTGLAKAATLPGRFTVLAAGGVTVIDDTYNANPLSMAASIEAAQKLAKGQPLLLALGEMGELGTQAQAAHEELGRMAARSGCRTLFFKGEHAPQVEQGLKREGFTGKFYPVKTADDFDTFLETTDISEGVALFKGSRSAHMEELLEAYLARHRTGHGGAR